MTDTIPYLTTRPTRDTGSRIIGRDANGHKCLFASIPFQTEPIPLGNEAYFRGYFEASLVTQGTASPDVASVVKFKCKSLDGEPLLIPGNLLSVFLCNSGTFADSTNGLLTAANGSVAKRTIVSTKALVVSAADTAVATLATAQGSNQDITLTAVDAGVDGNSISYTYQVGAASGALACAVTGTDIVVTGAMTAGTAQVESATVVAPSGATANGTLKVVVTGAAMSASPQNVYVDLTTAANTATLVATAIKTAMGLNSVITAAYTIGGSAADITLTAITKAANDATLSLAWNASEVAGVSQATSAGVYQRETAVVLADNAVAQVETATVVAAAGATENGILTVAVTGVPLGGTVYVPVTLTTGENTAALVAEAIRAALAAHATIPTHYTIARSNAEISLTALVKAANDTTLAIAFDGAVAGVTQATGAGVPQVETATAVGTGGTAEIGSITVATTANSGPTEDGTLNVVFVSALTGTVNVPVALLNSDADDAAVAEKIKAALAATSAISTHWTITRSTADVVATAVVKAANDTSLDISYGGYVGGVTASSGAPFAIGTPGVAPLVSGNGDISVSFTAADVTAGTPVVTAVAVLANDTMTDVADKIAAALAAVGDINATWTVTNTGPAVIATANSNRANDSTLSITWGATLAVAAVASSVNTTAGARAANLTAGSVGTCTGGTLAVVLTVGGVTDAAQNVVVTNGHTPTQVASALAAGLTKTGFAFTSSGASLLMTSSSYAIEDATLNIAWAGAGGITAVTTSTNTTLGARTQNLTAGVAPALSSTATQIAAIINGTAAAALLVTAEATPGNGSGTAAAVTHTHLTGGGTGAQDEFIVAVNDATAESVTLRIGPPPMGGKMQGLWDETFDLTHA